MNIPSGLLAAFLCLNFSLPAVERPLEHRGEEASSPSGKLAGEEIEKRLKALDSWTFEPLALDATVFLFHLDRRDGSFFFQDRQTTVKWFSSWGRRGFASALVKDGSPDGAGGPGKEPAVVAIDRIEDVRADDKAIRFRGTSSKGSLPAVDFCVEVLPGKNGVALRYDLDEKAAEQISGIRILEDTFWIADFAEGGAAFPIGMGDWRPAAGADTWSMGLGARPVGSRVKGGDLRQLELPFLGLNQLGNPLLITWTDPAIAVKVERRSVPGDSFPGEGGVFTSVEFSGSHGAVEIRTLGREWSPVVDAARGYSSLVGAESPERVATLRHKTGLRTELRSFLGAAIFRPDLDEGHDFDSLAARAERLHEKLGIDRAAFVLRDWASGAGSSSEAEGDDREGFTARKDVGGNSELAACSQRIQDKGFIFGLEVAVPLSGDGSPSWKTLLERAQNQAGFEIVQDLYSPQLLLVEAPSPATWAACSGEELAARVTLGRLARNTFGLAAFSNPLEVDVESSVYLEGVADDYLGRPVATTFWPILTATYGHCVRMGASPALAARPDDPVGVLKYLLLGEVPCYELPAGKGEAGSRGDDDPRWTFAREDGWARGKDLTPHEIFLKNTYEVLSHVARLRSREVLLFHRPLVPDGSVRESYFGPDLRVVVNFGPGNYEDPEEGFLIPPLGFVVRHPFLLAFHASRMNNVTYERPALFVVRSLEGKMYLRAERVLLYRGFGPNRIDLGGKTFHVDGESVVKIW